MVNAELVHVLQRGADMFGLELSEEMIEWLDQYFVLLQRWNPRLHLVAPCSPAEFAVRHVLESLTALQYLPEGARVADVGSGGGLPIIPLLIARRSLRATLIEASPKKAVFLREAIAELSLNAEVIAERFEKIPAPDVEFVTCRALEKFAAMLPAMIDWAPLGAKLLFFGGESIALALNSLQFEFSSVAMPNSEARYLFMIKNRS